MLFADYFLWALIALGVVVSLPAIWMLCRAMWPVGFEKRYRLAQGSVFRTLLVGLLPTALTVVFLAATGKFFGLLAVYVAGVVVLWSIGGLTGLATLTGERLWPQVNEPWRQTRNGGLVLVCCALLPIIGTFLLLPLLIVFGMGANIQALMLRREPLPAAPTPPPLA
jgi:hypothetical protein